MSVLALPRTMTKAELIERISRSRDLPPDITKKCIADILDLAFEELAAYFARARVTRTQTPRFTFPGFGSFTKKKRSARRGVNPRTLQPIQIDACSTLDFKPSALLRAAMNGGEKPVRRKSRGGSASSGKTAARTTGTKTRAQSTTAGNGHGSKARRRPLTPRDEDAELDALIDDDALFEEDVLSLPASSMKRAATTSRRGRGRSTG